jgi:hypothetical protein
MIAWHLRRQLLALPNLLKRPGSSAEIDGQHLAWKRHFGGRTR